MGNNQINMQKQMQDSYSVSKKNSNVISTELFVCCIYMYVIDKLCKLNSQKQMQGMQFILQPLYSIVQN